MATTKTPELHKSEDDIHATEDRKKPEIIVVKEYKSSLQDSPG